MEYVDGTLTIRPTVLFATSPMPTAICSGDELSVAFDATIAGENGTVGFAWSRNHTDDVTGTASGSGDIEELVLTTAATQTVTFTVTPTFTPTEGEAVVGTPATFTVTVNATPAVTTEHINVNCAEMGSATITVSNGGAPLSCLWNGEQTAALAANGDNHAVTFSNLEEGEYPFVVTNVHGCTAQGSVVIVNPVTISASQSIADDEICDHHRF